MTTNLVESINLILKKTRNLPISALVKSTYIRYNALFDQRRREVATMLTSDQVYTQFNRCDTWFLVQETINPRKVWPTGNFTVRLDERWCDCGKLQKLHMPCSHVVIACKHAHHEYKSYIHLVYKLQSVSNKRNSKGRLFSRCMHTEMNIRESSQPKRCSMCRIPDHSKKNCSHRIDSSQQR
ncbi:hypothetical protein JHK82_048318 [Glycine max]|nr:hypothetical protein JHK82_048318 [Glycine max]